MLNHPSFRPALVVGVVVAATTWFATRAGDLNPPKGPIQPTMVSLEDLYNRIGTQENCPTCTWNHKFVSRTTVGNSIGQVLTGSGVLHAVLVPGYGGSGGDTRLYDWVYTGQAGPPPESTLGQFPDFNLDVPPTVLVLDVRFTQGITVTGLENVNGGGITLLYRLDP